MATKKRKQKIIEDKKLRGEWAEMQFMARAAEHGLPVSKPWGEMNSFDSVVGKPQHFASVQVKSTIFKLGAGYDCTVRGHHTVYRPGSFDFLAAYIVPEDIWYIVPAKVIRGKDSITFYPGSKTSKYEVYREAWQLLREATQGREDSRDANESPVEAEEGKVEVEVLEEGVRRPAGDLVGRMQATERFVRNFFERRGGRLPKG